MYIPRSSGFSLFKFIRQRYLILSEYLTEQKKIDKPSINTISGLTSSRVARLNIPVFPANLYLWLLSKSFPERLDGGIMHNEQVKWTNMTFLTFRFSSSRSLAVSSPQLSQLTVHEDSKTLLADFFFGTTQTYGSQSAGMPVQSQPSVGARRNRRMARNLCHLWRYLSLPFSSRFLAWAEKLFCVLSKRRCRGRKYKAKHAAS